MSALEAAARERDPANADFVDGASYYLGEVLRRGCPSRWVYIDFKDEGDPITANFKLQLNDDAGYTCPFHLHSLAIKDGDPGPTRAYYDTGSAKYSCRPMVWRQRNLGTDQRGIVVESEPLDWWLDWINVLIGAMWDANLRGVVELDYSQDSLTALENFVRERYRGRYPLGDDSFNAGVVAYLGETLMRVGGGAWEWTTEDFPDTGPGDLDLRRSLAKHEWHVSGGDEVDAAGLPIVRPDPAPGLPPLSPMHLLLDAAESNDGSVWAATYQRWHDAVGAYTATHPGWAPTKQHTLADGVIDSPPVSAVLDDWLARQREGFPQWSSRYGGNWDYSPESIDRLTGLVTQVTPTMKAFYDPANADFVEGATYYLGETLRRGTPCRWVYRRFPFDRSDNAPVTADFNIQKNTNTDFTGPFDLLAYVLEKNNPAAIRAFYHEWTKIPRQQ